MPTIGLAEAQQLEVSAPLRIKFAAISPHGDLVGDAHDEYPLFFQDPPKGWTAAPLGTLETRTEADRDAWQLSNDEIAVVAVEHETGIELLLVPVITELATSAVTALAKWGWRRWRELRAEPPHPKEDPSFVIEVPRLGGPEAPPIRLILPPPVSDDDIERYLRIATSLPAAGSQT